MPRAPLPADSIARFPVLGEPLGQGEPTVQTPFRSRTTCHLTGGGAGTAGGSASGPGRPHPQGCLESLPALSSACASLEAVGAPSPPPLLKATRSWGPALGLTLQECNHEDCSAGPTARMLIAASQAKILPKFPSATLSFQYSFYNVLSATLTLFLMLRFYG